MKRIRIRTRITLDDFAPGAMLGIITRVTGTGVFYYVLAILGGQA